MGQITSRNGRIFVGMTREDIPKMVENLKDNQNERAKKHLSEQLTKAFNTADGIVNVNEKDDVITEEEVKAYDKKMKRRKWIIGIAAYSAIAGAVSALIKMGAIK